MEADTFIFLLSLSGITILFGFVILMNLIGWRLLHDVWKKKHPKKDFHHIKSRYHPEFNLHMFKIVLGYEHPRDYQVLYKYIWLVRVGFILILLTLWTFYMTLILSL